MVLLAMQYNQHWIVFAVVAIVIVSMRSVMTTIMLLVAVFVFYFIIGTENVNVYWPIVVFGLIIVALLVGVGSKPQQPEYYNPGMYGDMFGGGGEAGGQ